MTAFRYMQYIEFEILNERMNFNYLCQIMMMIGAKGWHYANFVHVYLN